MKGAKKFIDRFVTIAVCVGLINRPASSSTTSFGISSPHPLLDQVVRAATKSIASVSQSMSVQSEVARPESGKVSIDPLELCDKMKLNERQKRLCNQGGGLPETLLEALHISASFCRQQFQYEWWNCPLDEQRLHTLDKLSRETAALYAFSAAGVEHAVSRACAAGRLKKCHCAEAENMVETRQTWKWGGCGDNLVYGRTFAAKFLDSRSSAPLTRADPSDANGNRPPRKKQNKNSSRTARGRWKRTMSTNMATKRKNELSVPKKSGKKSKESTRQRIDRNNNVVGMEVVEQLVNRTCKCHGVSGSCTMQTCWNQLAAFSETARVLKMRYEKAARYPEEISDNASRGSKKGAKSAKPAAKNRRNMAQPEENSQLMIPPKSGKNGRRKKPSSDGKMNKDQLLFLDDSPDICQANETSPIKGTTGRVCLRGENCEVLCCGRGYNVHKNTLSVPCHCKIIPCCTLQCENCLTENQIETCK